LPFIGGYKGFRKGVKAKNVYGKNFIRSSVEGRIEGQDNNNTEQY